MTKPVSEKCSNEILIQIVELRRKYREANKYFCETSKKANEIAHNLKEDQASLQLFEAVTFVTRGAQETCLELSSELGRKTFDYLQAGGEMQALAKALYDTPENQTAYLAKVAEIFRREESLSRG